jgi:hypothetical protein
MEISEGHVIVQLTSVTITLKPQLVAMPAVSVAVQVTAVLPIGKFEPEGGLQLDVTPGQLSVAVGDG